MNVKIRAASNNDIKKIVTLFMELAKFHEPMHSRFELSEDAEVLYKKYLTSFMSEMDEKSKKFVYVAEDLESQSIVGYIMGEINLQPPVFKNLNRGSISDLCVTESYRRQKIGEKLVKTAKKWFAQHDIQFIQMFAASKNAISLSFWKKMGFEPVMEQMYFQQ